MHRFLLVVLLLFSTLTYSQDTPGTASKLKDSLTGTTIKNTQIYPDSAQRAKEISDGLNYLMRHQREQKAKQKRQAMIYLAIGIGFLIILIIGLRRRMKK